MDEMDANPPMDGEMDAAMEPEMDAMDAMEAMDGMDGMEASPEPNAESPGMESPEMGEVSPEPMEGVEPGEGEEAQAVQVDYSADERLAEMRAYLQELYNYKDEEHWDDQFYQWMLDFLDDPNARSLFFWNDFKDEEVQPLRVSNTAPPPYYGEGIKSDSYNVACFLKRVDKEAITMGNLKTAVKFTMIFKEPLDDLLDKMNQDYIKTLLMDNDWPDGVKKEFVASVHRFMAFLNEHTHQARGQTYLYIPQEDLNDPEANAKDRDLLQRLESIVIGWTRQIKELVSSQDSPNSKAIETPLDEINYWQRRTQNLQVLTERLEHPDLKKITRVLHLHKSSYLEQFKRESQKISQGYEEAKDNLRFLGTLSEPCRKIATANPTQIPKLLPDVLNNVRVIWELSRFYNNEERMKQLLVKISNQIIDRCKDTINVNDMISGDVEKCMSDLQDSINCCKQWNSICREHQRLIKKYSSRKNWKLDEDETIFAENDAFIQRCKELQEICEGQLQFARKGKNQRMPIFGGVQGPTYTNNLLELEKKFNQNLQKIAALEYDILDVKQTQWHDDYGQLFKEDCKQLEITIHNIIQLAFKNVSTVQDAVEMLENFDTLAKRPLVKQFVNTKAADLVFKLFLAEIKEIEETYEQSNASKKAIPYPFSHPKWGGQAIWAYSLTVRLKRAREKVGYLHFIETSSLQTEALDKYQKLTETLDQFIVGYCKKQWEESIAQLSPQVIETKLNNQNILTWSQNSQNELPNTIQHPLFTKSKKSGLLESNFDSDLHKLIVEGTYWSKIMSIGITSIPGQVSKLLARKDTLRILRENVMLIVRDYNNIKHTINDDELPLFAEHLNGLEGAIAPGIRRFTWVSNADYFVQSCRKECRNVFEQVKKFQGNKAKIYSELEKISRTMLTSVEKILYFLPNFIKLQEDTMKAKEGEFIAAFERISIYVMDTYDLFLRKKYDIQLMWIDFMHQLDDSLSKALQASVKTTLLQFGKHIMGEKGQDTELVAIFTVYTILSIGNDEKWNIIHDPTHDELKAELHTFMRKIVKVTRVVPRIERVFRERRDTVIAAIKKNVDDAERSGGNTAQAFEKSGIKVDPNYQNLEEEQKQNWWLEKFKLPDIVKKADYVDSISKKSKIKDKIEEILKGIDMVEQAIEEDTRLWNRSDELRHISGYMNSKGRWLNKMLQSKTADEDPIAQYQDILDNLRELIMQIENKPALQSAKFINLDCSKLKESLLDHVNEIQQMIFSHLVREFKKELTSLIDDWITIIQRLKTPITNLELLKTNKELYEDTINKIGVYEGMLEPIRTKYKFIQAHEEEILSNELTQEDKDKLEALDQKFNDFREGLKEAHEINKRYTMVLKKDVDESVDEFKRECLELKATFQIKAPYNVEKDVKDKMAENQQAFDTLQEYKNQTIDLRNREEELKFGLDIFGIDQANYPEVTFIEKAIEQLNEVWNIKRDWDSKWMQIKDIQFKELPVDDMEMDAYEVKQRLVELPKEIRDWQVYQFLQQELLKFVETCPLIKALQHESMRSRHWKELRMEIKDDFDEEGDDFNLERIWSLNLLQFSEKINDLTDNARKQLNIEKGLQNIEHMWTRDPASDLAIAKERSRADGSEYFYIKDTGDIMQLIEDHGANLGQYKSSPYYKEFQEDIDLWESNIAKVTETLETLMTVQNLWQYLEQIFKGQQDIQKQLPHDNSVFLKNDTVFKDQMERINNNKNAIDALLYNGFLAQLNKLQYNFEGINKSLDSFLKQKRQQFPRFFFLSNPDLLEMIGRSKEPKKIAGHIRKIFEGVHDLNVSGDNQKSRGKNVDVEALVSSDNEVIEIKPCEVESKIEIWIGRLVDHMKTAIRQLFYKYLTDGASNTRKAHDKEKMHRQVREIPGQILIGMAQIAWTSDVELALKAFDSGNKAILKQTKRNYKKKVEAYVNLVDKQQLDKKERLRLVALIIIDQHHAEIVAMLIDKNISSYNAFEWQMQLRFYKESEDTEDCNIGIRQTKSYFDYGAEYQGNNGRLVVTELTDRCYMTLTSALHMYRGGAPQGPAGTGKTETVKDLAKNLAFFTVIQNCSASDDIFSLGKLFTGLALDGAWGCFDEFNRISVDVLSVVAGQVQTLLDAQKHGESNTTFMDATIQVKKTCGIFITMNPGYAGRSALPDNLASLFRPVAMMKPDFQGIIKISLMSEGFSESDELSKKIAVIYDLMLKQLSKQDHYDFGMRAIKSVLSATGNIKRENRDMKEVTVCIKAIRDMNLPKFVADDVVLFDNLFIDLFPDCEEPENDNDELQIAIEEALMARNLMLNENLIVKIIQLYDSQRTRHGNMLVGLTQSGKSRCWQVLQDALNALADEEQKKGVAEDKMRYKPAKVDLINPKAINDSELFGSFDDQNPPQWQDGILSSILKRNAEEKYYMQWMILDGPVDTLWVESLNSVLDDSKLLTLTNGDRISLSPNIRMLFEVENLSMASPATVSRAGMIYLDYEELGWEPYMFQWIQGKKDEEMRDLLTNLRDKYLPKVLKVKRMQCTELVPTNELSCVVNMCRLFDCLSPKIVRGDEESIEEYQTYVEKWFVFSIIWSIGATVDEQSRKDIDSILRDIESVIFPPSASVFDYNIKLDKRDFVNWDDELKTAMKIQETEFHKITVPTADTVRNRFIVRELLAVNAQILLVGHAGVGKTVLMNGILDGLDHTTSNFTINFSAGTTSNSTQDIIELAFERRAKNKYKPKNAKSKVVCFIDDMNMPRRDTYGSQPPLELIRQWMDYEFWYDRQKIVQNNIQGLQLLAAMGKPGGGRQPISNRLMSCFHSITYTQPDNKNMMLIYSTIASIKFTSFFEDIKVMSDPLAQATIEIFKKIQQVFLPTPSKSHYIFNMRDISKVFQGLYMANKNYYESRESIAKLWAHEVLRVFNDRLNTEDDRNTFKNMVDEQLINVLDLNYEEHCTTDGKDAIFVDFLNDLGEQIYQEVTDFDALKDHLNESLIGYNAVPKNSKMDLVLFRDAIIHVAKIYRIINLKRGHALLIGVGGSGRHSLTRLASFLQKMNVFQLEVTKGFKLKNFREFLKEIYAVAGAGMQVMKSTFIFSDNDVVQESFLEDIQNMLNLGIVPNLYSSDEMGKVREDFRRKFRMMNKGVAETPDNMDTWFFNNVKDNLHLSICFSPLSKMFKDYTRSYPALINNTTIDWFMKWPEDALNEVALKFIGDIDVQEDQVQAISQICAHAHATTTMAAEKMQMQLKRIFYVTPTNYIELLKGYQKILEDKRAIVLAQSKKLRDGLHKLDGASQQVAKMSAESDAKRQQVQRESRSVDDLLQKIAAERKGADEKSAFIEVEREKIGKEREEAEALAAEAEADLKVFEPELLAAQAAIESLDSKSISEVKAYNNPPPAVMQVMSAVMIILGHEPTWATAKKKMDAQFLKTIQTYDRENTSQATLKRIEKFTSQSSFQPDIVGNVSNAGKLLCIWVKAVEGYAKALKTVAPKRQRMQYARDQVAKKMAVLKELEDEYEAIAKRLVELENEYNTNIAALDQLRAVLNDLMVKMERGEKLIAGLANEKLTWEATIDKLDTKYINLVGDCLLSAAFMSYCGPFPADYRTDLCLNWKTMVQSVKLPYSEDYNFATFMASEAQAREWQQRDLPTDSFSTENGCFVTKGLRWALNVDPQTQAMNWIKKMEPDIQIADMKDSSYMKIIEGGIRFGKKVLFLDVGEEIDPVLDNVLNKSLITVGRSFCVKIGDKEIEYDPKFKLYITTRMQNPHYTPEVSTKVTVVNFTVKQEGLEEQCLDIVVGLEQPTVQKQRDDQIKKIEDNNATILQLEDDILQRLQDADPELILENVALIDKLDESKATQIEVKETLANAKQAMRKITEMREQYRACGRKASILFFVLNDLSKINPMYQFSLDWYKGLFRNSIVESGEQGTAIAGSGSKERTKEIIDWHRLSVYNTVCRSLFERHKILLSLQMTIKEQIHGDNPPDMAEWNFFLKGGEVLDRASQMPKPPFDWITRQMWDNITELDKLSETFKGISQALMLSPKDWQRWYQFPDPEERALPGEWQTKCEERLKSMIVLRCLRPDRVIQSIKKYIEEGLGSAFTRIVPTNLATMMGNSINKEPVIFVLSPGVDPTSALKKLAEEQGIQFETKSMGKGQGDKLEGMLGEAAQLGKWVFLANCHLSIFLLPELEKIMDNLFKEDAKKDGSNKVHSNFRLILSAENHPDFSISMLQRSLKITQEPPKGIKANMYKLYGTRSEFQKCEKNQQFRKAVFGLSWFHTILIERKKFKSLGWNVQYAFNDSDFSVCEDVLAMYMGKLIEDKTEEGYRSKDPIPWSAINTLIAQCNYGGRVTDDRDRKLLTVYAKEIFNDDVIAPDMWRPPGTDEDRYHYPADEQQFKGPDPYLQFTPAFFQEKILADFNDIDYPRAYGQHENAEITSQILDTNELLQSVLTLTPQDVNLGGAGGDGGLIGKIKAFQEAHPEYIDRFALRMKLKADSGNPLNVVLQQEVDRYAVVLKKVEEDLAAVNLAVQGLLGMTPELELIVTAVQNNITPAAWNFAYFSMKPLSNWFEDLCLRYAFFDEWAQKGAPFCFWIGAMMYPTGFTTALLQKFSRKASGAPIDQLQFEFIDVPRPAHEIMENPKDGAYIVKMYLEGAKWDYDGKCLTDANPMELTCMMPVIHFKPVTKQKKAPTNLYPCPAYYYPMRQGTVYLDSFQMYVDLKCGEKSIDFWIKRGTAILFSLGN